MILRLGSLELRFASFPSLSSYYNNSNNNVVECDVIHLFIDAYNILSEKKFWFRLSERIDERKHNIHLQARFSNYPKEPWYLTLNCVHDSVSDGIFYPSEKIHQFRRFYCPVRGWVRPHTCSFSYLALGLSPSGGKSLEWVSQRCGKSIQSCR
jgi:hypothetical protein